MQIVTCSNATGTLHLTISTTNNCQVLIYLCTHTIKNANIQHSSIMKPQYVRSYLYLIGIKIIHSRRIQRT